MPPQASLLNLHARDVGRDGAGLRRFAEQAQRAHARICPDSAARHPTFNSVKLFKTVVRKQISRLTLLLAAASSTSFLAACAGNDAAGEQQELPACLPPGDYELHYALVDDTCGGFPTPATELFTIRTDGTAAGASEPPTGCTDGKISDVDCVRDSSRRCRFPLEDGRTLEATYTFVLDLTDHEGSVSIAARWYNGQLLADACNASFRIALTSPD